MKNRKEEHRKTALFRENRKYVGEVYENIDRK